MPPEGKVGVSPVCILGVNINRGQEVSLRLRTDDLQGEAAGWAGAGSASCSCPWIFGCFFFDLVAAHTVDQEGHGCSSSQPHQMLLEPS
jgi:hypothetical protein